MHMKRIVCLISLTVIIGLVFPGYADELVDIAAIYALTGAAAEANAHALKGVGWAVDEINRQGGILGRAIRLRVIDNQSTPIGATLAARQAAELGVLAIVGPDWSSHSLAVARVAQPFGIPMITSLSTNPQVTRIGNYIFRICFTDDFQGKVIANFAHLELGAATACIFVDVTSDYSLKLSEIFRRHFEQLGGQVLLELEYKLKQQHFDDQLKQLAKVDPDAIFIPGHDESGFIAGKIQDAGISAFLIGGDGWSAPSFFKKGGYRLKQGFYTAHWSQTLSNERSKAFVEKYNIRPDSVEDNIALGYDAMMVLADAMSRSKNLDRHSIRDAIEDTKAFQGVTGIINFNDYGDPIKGIVVMEIREGKPRYLKTLKPLR
jgi:branched-chain amino acid transport system substrate-binding protein